MSKCLSGTILYLRYVLDITELEEMDFISQIKEKVGKHEIFYVKSTYQYFIFLLSWLKPIIIHQTLISFIMPYGNFKENICFYRKSATKLHQ